MARKKKGKYPQVKDYRHEDAKRENIPPAGSVVRSGIPKIVRWKPGLL